MGPAGAPANAGGTAPVSRGFDRLAACGAGPFTAPLDVPMALAKAVAGSEGASQGFEFLEGPVWLDGALYFSRISKQNDGSFPSVIRRFTPPSSFADVVARAGSNGLAIDQHGDLVAASHEPRAVQRFDLKSGVATSLVSTVAGQPFNSPNDLAIHSNGTIYFTDPNWQNAMRPSVGATNLYVLANSGGLTTVATPFNPTGAQEGGPNGVALSLDERTLYVSGNQAQAPFSGVVKFPVNADGSLGQVQAFASANAPIQSSDGLTLDCAGNLYVAQGTDGIRIYDAQANPLGQIMLPTGPATNSAFGGADASTLFISSWAQGVTGLYSITLAVPGLPY